MSAEEKSPLLSKDSKDEGEIPRPKVPVVDYSRKTFYDYLGLKSDASIKTIKSTYDELAKKYNPRTNPDEISKFQDIFRSGEILTNEFTKEFYDEYGDISIVLYEFFQKYFPYVVEGRPISYIYVNLFTLFGALILLLVTVSMLTPRLNGKFSFSWYGSFLPTILVCIMYIVYVIVSRKRGLKHAKKDEELAKRINKRSLISIGKALLLIAFQICIINYLSNDRKGFLPLYCLPYLAFEALTLYKDTVMFKKGAEAIKSNKEVDCPILKKDNYIKYLTGISNTKCEQNKEGKKGGCTSCAIRCLFLRIYHTDLIRLIQNLFFMAMIVIKPSFYTPFFLPVFISFILSIAEMIVQNKIGYVRSTCESLISIFWIVIGLFIIIDVLFLLGSIDFSLLNFNTHIFPFLVEDLLLGGLLAGVLPFIPIMEFKMKHDETDAPMF